MDMIQQMEGDKGPYYSLYSTNPGLAVDANVDDAGWLNVIDKRYPLMKLNP